MLPSICRAAAPAGATCAAGKNAYSTRSHVVDRLGYAPCGSAHQLFNQSDKQRWAELQLVRSEWAVLAPGGGPAGPQMRTDMVVQGLICATRRFAYD